MSFTLTPILYLLYGMMKQRKHLRDLIKKMNLEHKLAFLPKSSELNEHATTAIRTPEGKELMFKQIAGTFARRVVSYSHPGLSVRAGEQCGIIKLGSRIDFFLPLDAEVLVDEGDRVRACETLIARL